MNVQPTILDPAEANINTTDAVYKTLVYYNNLIVNVGKDVTTGFADQVVKAQDYQDKATAMMNKQLEILETYKIDETLTEMTVENTFTISKHEGQTPPFTRYEQETYKLEGKTNTELQNAYREWRVNIDYVYQYMLKLIQNNVQIYTKNDSASGGTALALQQLLADDIFTKISEVEKQIDYRRFYFPGSTVVLKVLGKDETIKTGDGWDPRYLKEYVNIANERGFERWMLAPIGVTDINSFKPINYDDVNKALTYGIDWLNNPEKYVEGSGYTLESVAEYVAPLVYFNKIEDYIKNGNGMPNDLDYFNNWLELDIINKAVTTKLTVMEKAFKRSATQFQKLDTGYYATINQAFDAEKLTQQLVEYNEEYSKYKAKLWKLIEGSSVLQLCFNYSNMTGNNIDVNQVLECNQWIGENNTSTSTEFTDPTDAGGGGDGTESNGFDVKAFWKENQTVIIVGIIVIVVLLILFFMFNSSNTSNEEMLLEMVKKQQALEAKINEQNEQLELKDLDEPIKSETSIPSTGNVNSILSNTDISGGVIVFV